MIVDGRVGLMQYDTIDRFEADGVVLKDGTKKPLDLVVVATGYESQQEFVRATLGNDVAERIGPVWGFDDGGELRNMWGPTKQDGLWFTAGSLAQCRIYSRYLALQIKAREDGLIE
jgi:putative flavoprotein involved in K+ transport